MNKSILIFLIPLLLSCDLKLTELQGSMKTVLIDNYDLSFKELPKTAFTFNYDSLSHSLQINPAQTTYAKVLNVVDNVVLDEIEFGNTNASSISRIEANQAINNVYINLKRIGVDNLTIIETDNYGDVISFDHEVKTNELVGYQGRYSIKLFVKLVDDVRLTSKPCLIKVMTKYDENFDFDYYLKHGEFKDVWSSFKYVR